MVSKDFVPNSLAVITLVAGSLPTAGAKLADLPMKEQEALRDALADGNLKRVKATFEENDISAFESIRGTNLYWYGVTGKGRTGQERLDLIAYLLERGGPSPSGNLSVRDYLLSFVPDTTPEFLQLIDSHCSSSPPFNYRRDSALARAAATQNPQIVEMVLARGDMHPEANSSFTMTTSRDDENRKIFVLDGPPPVVAAVWGGAYNYIVGMDTKYSVDFGKGESRSGPLRKLWRSKVKPGGMQRRPRDEAKVLEALKLLEDAPQIDWEASDAFRMTALHYAALLGMPEVIKFLLEKGLSTRQRDYWGRSPILMLAAGEGSPPREVLDLLGGEDGEGLLATDRKGNTLLSLALKEGNSVFAGDLILRGIDPFIVNEDLKSAADSARAGSAEEKAIAGALKSMGARMPFAYEARPQKRLVKMPALMFSESAVSAVGSSSSTILTINARRPAYSEGPMNVRFNRPVGASMQGSLPKVSAHIASRIGGWPDGLEAEIRFENRYGGKDGDSASVVCGLLLYSALTSYEIDEAFCCTGAMDPDGKVRPIGGLAKKLSAVNRAGYSIMGVPPANALDLRDHMLLNGIADLAGPQIFTMETFDDAMALASADKPEPIAKAIEICAPVMRVLAGGRLDAVKHPSVHAKLREVLAIAPNHLSAQLLMEAGLGKLPKTLSLRGCYEALNDAYRPMELALSNHEFEKIEGVDENLYATTVSLLTRLRPKLDPRARKLADLQSDYARTLQGYREHPPTSPKGIQTVVSKLNTLRSEVSSELKRFAKAYNAELEALLIDDEE